MKFIVALAFCVAVAVAAPQTYDSAATILNQPKDIDRQRNYQYA